MLSILGDGPCLVWERKADGTYLVEFGRPKPRCLRFRFRETEAAVIRHFQARMPSCLIWRRTDQRQKATREPSRVASETNCRSDPVPFAVLKY